LEKWKYARHSHSDDDLRALQTGSQASVLSNVEMSLTSWMQRLKSLSWRREHIFISSDRANPKSHHPSGQKTTLRFHCYFEMNAVKL
jgi:hypothetical protein